MRVLYLGNFSPEHSTENHVARALEANGHQVVRHQEGSTWSLDLDGVDFVLWTSTNDLAPPATFDEQTKMLAACAERGIPTVGYHLDLWWGLQREHQIREKPFFRVDLLCTADGGHDDEWVKAGIDHQWMPPGVSEAECAPGTFHDELAADVIFVGSWQGGYHRESKHREQLVRWLQRTYAARCVFWPHRGQPAVRGEALRDLYASAKVAVGDSCMVPHLARYHSDRIPETLGRGGFLIHPHVDGVTDGLYRAGVHLATWQAGDWGVLRSRIDRFVDDDDKRTTIARLGREHVLRFHTYERRMETLVALMQARGLV